MIDPRQTSPESRGAAHIFTQSGYDRSFVGVRVRFAGLASCIVTYEIQLRQRSGGLAVEVFG